MLKTEDTVCVCIDVQEKLVRAMYDKERLINALGKLISGMHELTIPVLITEQNPHGLGPTIPEISEHCGSSKRITKLSFSCWDTASFQEALKAYNRRQVVLAGIEAHVCVYQTAVDLVSAGYRVEVATDCIASRTEENKQIAMMRMKDAGAALTTTEILLFEMIRTAESPRFKRIASIIK